MTSFTNGAFLEDAIFDSILNPIEETGAGAVTSLNGRVKKRPSFGVSGVQVGGVAHKGGGHGVLPGAQRQVQGQIAATIHDVQQVTQLKHRQTTYAC